MKQVAGILEEHGKIYILKNGYIQVRVYSSDRALIDALVRTIGRVREHGKGRIREWTWARQTEMREFLPQIIPYIKDIELRLLYVHIYRWTVSHGPSKDRRLEETKMLLNGWRPRTQR